MDAVNLAYTASLRQGRALNYQTSSDMLPGIFQQSSFDALGLAAAAIELYFGAGECQIEPMIPKWVTGESASSYLDPELTSFRKFFTSRAPISAPVGILPLSTCHFG